jgi:hypothetical protein
VKVKAQENQRIKKILKNIQIPFPFWQAETS